MKDSDLDLLIYLHERFSDPARPLTPDDIAYITGRLEQTLKDHGVIPIRELDDTQPSNKWKFPGFK